MSIARRPSPYFPNGTAAAPSIRFGSELTGFYRFGANQIALSSGGVVAATWERAFGGGGCIATAQGWNFYVRGGGSALILQDIGGNAVLCTGGGNVLVGTSTDGGNGRLQFTTHTTSAGGIGFGTDVSLYRTAAGQVDLGHVGGGAPRFRLAGSGTAYAGFELSGVDLYIDTYSAGKITFRSGSQSIALTLDATQGATFTAKAVSTHPTAGVGYATGAGGTVVQATNKATGVTLNKVCGQITMNAAALASGAIVSFVLTDSAIGLGDQMLLNHVSGGTPGAYVLNARAAAGSATIDVRNGSAGSLSEAIVIGFSVIKSVTA